MNFDWILIDEYKPLGDTRYVFRISKYIELMKKKAIQNAKVGKFFWPVIEMCMQIMQITGMPKIVKKCWYNKIRNSKDGASIP